MMRTAPRHHFPSVDSTITRGWDLEADGLSLPFWVTADEQVAGRGRTQRHWHSPKGNLYSTLLIRAEPGWHRNLLPFAVSVAVRTAVLSSLPPRAHRAIQLKWPNDVLADGEKLSGILIESRQIKAGDVFAIGVGINVDHAPQGLDRPATCLRDLGGNTSIEEVFHALQDAMEIAVKQMAEAPDTIIPTWSRGAIGFGKPVTVRLETEVLNGTFDHLAADGALMLRQSSGAVRAVYAGDLFVPEG